jgi:hypothetical protein
MSLNHPIRIFKEIYPKAEPHELTKEIKMKRMSIMTMNDFVVFIDSN